MFSFSPPPGGTKIGCCVVFCCILSTVTVSIQVISFRLLVVELFSCLIAAEVLTSLKNLRQAAPNFHARRRLTRESQPPVQQSQSAFHPHAQRNAFRRRNAGGNVIETHEHKGDFKDAQTKR